MAIYTVFDEESESEVPNTKFQAPEQKTNIGKKIYKKQEDIRNSFIFPYVPFKSPRPVQLAMYTAFDEESESEVQNAKFQAPEGKN